MERQKTPIAKEENFYPHSVEEKAFEWSVDYKPMDDDLPPEAYARAGFEEGYNRALADILQGSIAFVRSNDYGIGVYDSDNKPVRWHSHGDDVMPLLSLIAGFQKVRHMGELSQEDQERDFA